MKPERDFTGDPVSGSEIHGLEQFFADEGWGGKIKNRQDIFDRVVRHHRQQGSRCPVEGRGLYRKGARMCFVGPLIENDQYDPGMEGYHARDLPKLFAMPQWFRTNIEFITDLQNIHDTESNWPNGRMDIVLELFAAERGLTMPL
jgi:hypothetical protein